MKFIITILFGVAIAFLIDYFFRRRRTGNSENDANSEVNQEQNSRKDIALKPNDKPKSTKVKRIGKFALLYFSVAFSSAILSGVLGGLAQAYATGVYTVAKFVAPVIVYIVILHFLSKRLSLAFSAKLMSYVYVILIILRVVFHISMGEQLGVSLLRTVLPYVFLLLVSVAVYFGRRPKE